MEVVYKEQCEVTREYSISVYAEEFLEWLDGDKPTEENLQTYIQNEFLPWQDPDTEDEHTILTELEGSDFLKLCEECLEDDGNSDE